MSTKLEEKIGSIVRHNVREAIRAELMRFRALVLPAISKAEQRDIEKRYGRPLRRGGKTYRIVV